MDSWNPDKLNSSTKKPYSVATVISLLLGILFSIAIYFVVDYWEQSKLESTFELSARNHFATIHNDIVRHQEVVNSIAGLFSSSQHVSRKEFRSFVQGALTNHPDIQALSWNPVIKYSEKKQYINLAQRDGLSNFKFSALDTNEKNTVSPKKDDSVTVYYIEPYFGNEKALGFNIASHPARLKAIDEACETGKVVITERIKLIQEKEGGYAYLLLKAIYKKGKSTDTVEQRKKAFIGLAAGVFRFDDLLSMSKQHSNSAGIDMWVSDRSAPVEKQFLHYKPSPTHVHPPTPSDLNYKLATQGLHWRTTTNIFGRDWEFLFSAAPEYFKGKVIWQAWASFLIGILFTILLTLYLYSRQQQIENLAAKNDELRQENLQRKSYELELKEQRDFSKTILEASANVIVVMDLNACFVVFNPAAEKITGYKSEEVIGKPVWELVIPREQEPGVRNVFENLKKGELSIADHYENEWLTRDGGRRLLHWSNSILRDKDGNINYVMALGYDITEQRENEKQQEQMKNELKQAQKMESLGQLTGGIAHDFNNILGIIVGYSDLIKTKYANKVEESLIKYIENIHEAGERASKLVDQMLTFSRGDQAKSIPVKFEPLIKDEIRMLRSTLPSTIEIKEQVEPNLPEVIMNPTQLHQILMNLSINAGDAMNSAGVLTIKLSYTRDLDTKSSVSHKPVKGNWVELSVSDTGSGISPEIIDKIFDPFFTTKDVGQGTGMGLSVIYRIMEDHNGHILIESEEGKGSTFRMLFPPLTAEENINENLDGISAEAPKGDNEEILIVDDEELLAMQLSELVAHHGYKQTFVTDSTEAFELFNKEPDRFSLLITDQTMPNMTGVELIENIRNIRPNTPVIMCSGYSNKINANSAAALNFSYFDKPVAPKELLSMIARLIKDK